MELILFPVIAALSAIFAYMLHFFVKHLFLFDFLKAHCIVIFAASSALALFTLLETVLGYPHYYGNEPSLGVFFDKVFVTTFYAQHPAFHILIFSAVLASMLAAGWIWTLAYTINRMNRRRSHGLPTPLD